MKKTIMTAVLSIILISSVPGLAQQTPPAGQGGQENQEAPGVVKFDEQMARIQENMKKMQEQVEKIRQTQDPQERQRLLLEHWTTMQEQWG